MIKIQNSQLSPICDIKINFLTEEMFIVYFFIYTKLAILVELENTNNTVQLIKNTNTSKLFETYLEGQNYRNANCS